MIQFFSRSGTIGLFVSFFTVAAVAGAAPPDRRTLIDADWLFHRGDFPSTQPVIAADYDDHEWKAIDLPHDYVLDGKYAKSDEKTVRGHGYLPYEVGWYRKRLTIPESARGKVLRLDFDGVFRDSEVWLNGQSLGKHPSGYTPFSYDITKLAKIGGDNLVTVRVDPREFEGWWYEGGGIYRHVYLTALSPLHVAQYGTYVVSEINGDHADVTIRTDVQNSGAAAAQCEVVSEIVDPDGHSLKTVKIAATVGAGQMQETIQKPAIDQPKLWSFDSPQLYELRTTIMQNGAPVDSTTTTFGIRTLRFDANEGFFLNGKHVVIQGAASHQDFSACGIAVPDSLQAWRVAQLKKAGTNGWRTAHNPPNEALLEACDRLGMLVMDENRHFGDSYRHHTLPDTAGGDNLSDLATMIRRDRNHPSIIMWSMCNEEGHQGRPEGVAVFKKMMAVVHQYDQTRPITSAMNGGWTNPQTFADVEDLIGINYNTKNYDIIRKRWPNKMMYGSECMNEKTTRGEYADVPETGMRSCYNLSEEAFLAIANRPHFGGAYMWTGFDYRGEPNPYGWPDISNNTGLLDVCGFPKDKSYYFQSCWSDKPMVHLVPGTWNWPGKEGQNIRVLAFSNAKRVELLLNGRSLGAQDMPHDAHAEWQVPYEPGTLSAKASSDAGNVVATDEVQTTGEPARIKLSTDRTTLHVNGQDAVVVTLALLDEKGRVVPDADKRVTFRLEGGAGGGGAKVLGVGNGNPADHDPDRADNRNTFHGRCIAIIQAGRQAATPQLSATSPGLSSDSLSFDVR